MTSTIVEECRGPGWTGASIGRRGRGSEATLSLALSSNFQFLLTDRLPDSLKRDLVARSTAATY